MFFKVLFLCFLSAAFVAYVFCTTCLPMECLNCSTLENIVAETCNRTCFDTCINGSSVDSSCKINFSVSINASGSEVEEAETVSLICVHDLPDVLQVTYEWKKDKETIRGQQKREFIIKRTFSEHKGQYVCVVLSDCGNYMSAPHGVTIHNKNIIILVICGCAALVLVVIMGVSMKIKMYRDKAKNKERTQRRMQEMRRAQDLQLSGPASPLPTPTQTKS